MVTSSRITSGILLGGFLFTACASDTAPPGYENPSSNGGSGGSATGGAMGAGAEGGAGGTGGTGAAGGAGGTGGTGATGGVGGTGGMPPGPCDLSGRWLVVERSVEEAIGVQTALRHWMYFEFAQNGQDVTATRGLDCGFDVVPLSALGGAADLRKAWPKIMENNQMAGRKATIQQASSGCAVAFPAFVFVSGATAAHYKNKSNAMPGPNDKASGSTPGWEDWDADGNPGVTYNLSGIATGQVFYAGRQTNTWSGSISQSASNFTIATVPIHENALLGYSGSSLLTTPSNVAADRSLHFVEFARLSATQATGDDTATCNAVRMLASTLAPKGNAKPF